MSNNRWGIRLNRFTFAVAIFTISATSPPAYAQPQKHPKLTTLLADLARAVPQETAPFSAAQPPLPPAGFPVSKMPKSVRDAVNTRMMRISKSAQVQVYISVSEINEHNLKQLRAIGAVIELTDSKQKLVQARLPVTRLEAAAKFPFVRFIRLPDYGVPNTGSVTTQGDGILNAALARAQFGVNGAGIRIGVISDGIGGIFGAGCSSCTGLPGGPISAGDLPNAVGTRSAGGILISVAGGITAQSFRADANLEGCLGTCPASGVGAEGTAMLEIVHDIAPGAQLFFANFATDMEFNEAVNFLSANTDVVVDDIGFFGKPYDGTSVVSQNSASALNNNGNRIRARLNSVGNQARTHYQEDFFDSGLDGTSIVGSQGNLHLFQATADTTDILGLGPGIGDVIFLPAGASVRIFLVWNDPFGTSNNDYDLFLLQDGTGSVVARSQDFQTGTQPPVEFIPFVNTTGMDDFFLIIVQNFANLAAARNLDLFVLDVTDHNYNTVRSSVPAQSDAGGSPVSVISVGAARWETPNSIEDFSSNGPTNDGRLKPDLITVDGVAITGAGGFGHSPPGSFPQSFLGTSAASPHAAGVAALVLQSAPCLSTGSAGVLTPENGRMALRKLLLNNSIDLGVPGADNVFGFGRLDAFTSVSRTVPTANAGTNQTLIANRTGGAHVTLNGSASSDPNGCPLSFTWTGNCGTAIGSAPALVCPLGNNTETLRVTNNGITLSTPSTVQITVIPGPAAHFSVSAPTVVEIGKPFSVTVTARDQFNNLATGYTGTVHFSSSDIVAMLPGDYTFVAADNGSHIFIVKLNSVGLHTLNVADTLNISVSGTININVVQDLPLTAKGRSIRARLGQAFTLVVANFTDADTTSNAADFTATINWGDGTSSPGTVTANPAGGFDVSGMHTYSRIGGFAVTVQINSIGGSSVTASSSVRLWPRRGFSF